MYTNLLTQIKNAQAVKKENLKVPYSKMDMSVAEILASNKYIDSVAKKGRMPRRILDIKLRYVDGAGVINGFKFISKPSQRIYKGYKELRRVRQGYGMGVISTPKGVITTLEARKMKVGGQVLFEIW